MFYYLEFVSIINLLIGKANAEKAIRWITPIKEIIPTIALHTNTYSSTLYYPTLFLLRFYSTAHTTLYFTWYVRLLLSSSIYLIRKLLWGNRPFDTHECLFYVLQKNTLLRRQNVGYVKVNRQRWNHKGQRKCNLCHIRECEEFFEDIRKRPQCLCCLIALFLLTGKTTGKEL